MPRLAPPLVARLAAAVSEQRAQIEAILARAVRLDDPKVLHDLRVALRRAAALARLTRNFPTPDSGDPLRRTARDLRRFLSPHRTLEVTVERLNRRFRSDPARHAVAKKLAARIAPPSGGTADSAKEGQLRLAALRAAFTIRDAELSRISRPFVPETASRGEVVLARLVRRRLRKRRKKLLAAGLPERETLHPMRIAAKELRYELEFVRGLVAGVPELLREFQRFQDAAGDAHDRIELIRLVAEASAAAPPPLRREGIRLGPVLERDAALALRRARTVAGVLLERLSEFGIEWS